jgi:hypothetical protein
MERVRCLLGRGNGRLGEAVDVESAHRRGVGGRAGGRDGDNLIVWCYSGSFDRRQSKEHRPEWCGYPEPPAAGRSTFSHYFSRHCIACGV